MRLASGIFATCDRQRIEQVVSNLVTNAIRYGEGKPLDVALSCDGVRAKLEVRDRGIGIAPRDQQRIFQAFERAVTAATAPSGLGLGLHIVSQIVLAHGGTVSVESAPGAGSTFAVVLPVAPPEARPEIDG
jgi:signal transduction histidine kinase